jgi:signal transduction histidine kinase/ligand-binding sensor domain-containing protein
VRYFILTIQLALISFIAHSTPDVTFKNSNENFITLNQKQGLSQPGILSMVQDELGYVWVGTQAGLNRYDGYKFQQYSDKHSGFSLLAGNYISALCINSGHQLWIGTRSGISRYNYRTGKMISLTTEKDNLPSNKISSLSCQNDHVVVGTVNYGFFAVNATSGKIILDSKSPYLKVREVQQTAKHSYAATATGLYRQNKKTYKLEKLTDISSTAIVLAKQWIFVAHSDGSIARYDRQGDFTSAQWDNITLQSSDPKITQLVIQQDKLWVSSKQGVYKLDLEGNVIKHYFHTNGQLTSLTDNNIQSLLAIDNDNLWIGTANNGINHLNLKSSQFGHINKYTFNDGTLFYHDIRAFGFDENNLLWIGTSQGLYISNGQSINLASDIYPALKKVDRSFITALIFSDDKLWITTLNDGLVIYDFNSLALKKYFTPLPRVVKSFISLATLNNTILVIARSHGIFKLNEKSDQLEPFFDPSIELPPTFYDIEVLNNTLWAGTSGDGLYRYKKGKLSRFSTSTGSPTNIIYSLATGSNHTIWAATDKGVIVMDESMNLLQHIDSSKGLANEAVWDVVADNNGAMWAGTSGGLARIDMDNYHVTNFSTLDGIQGLEFNVGAAQLSSTGRVYIGGENGFNQFNPSELKTIPPLTQVVLSEVTVLGEVLSPIQYPEITQLTPEFMTQLNLNYQQDILSFTYSALDYSGQALQYFYRVKGLSDDWIMMNKESRQFNLLKLSPGTYKVEVYVKNSNGVSSKTHRLNISLAAPWWWNKASKLAYLIFILALVHWFYRLRQQAYIKLEKTVISRTQELSDKNDKLQQAQASLVESEKMAALGVLVAGVAHEINTPLGIVKTAVSHNQYVVREVNQLIESKSLTSRKLQQSMSLADDAYTLILSNLERAIHLITTFKEVAVDQSTETLREINLTEYLKEVMQALTPLLRNKNIALNIDGDNDINIISYPGPIYQILTNLINNSLKHGFEHRESGAISIKANNAGDNIIIIYTDNGKGIEGDILDKIYDPFVTTKRNKGGSGLGMHIVFNLITQLLKGKIECQSSMNQGVKFTITLPYKPIDKQH